MQRLHLSLIVVLALLGVAAVHLMSPSGIGVSPDSVDYLSLARSLAAGGGYEVGYRLDHQPEAKAHFPPLFPGLIAGMSRVLGQDAWPAATWLNSLLFGLNIFLAGFLVSRVTGSGWKGGAVSFLVLCSTDMLMVHAMAWSEPIFLAMMLTGFYLLSQYLKQGRSTWLVVAAVMCGLALLARYAAITLLLTGVFVVFFQAKLFRQRLSHTMLFGVMGSLPPLAWLFMNMSSSGSATNRSFVVHPVTLTALKDGVSTFSLWLIPDFIDTRVRIVLFLIVLSLLVWAAWKVRLDRCVRDQLKVPFARVWFYFMWIYPVFLVLYISFFSVGTHFNYRMMLPVLLGLIIWMPGIYEASRALSWFRTLLLILFVSYPVRAGVKVFQTGQVGGRGYAAISWQSGETMNWVRAHQGPEVLYSNGRDPIYILTQKIAGRLPRKIIYAHGTLNPDFDKEWQVLVDAMEPAGGYIVFFDALRWRKFMVDDAELKARLPTLVEHAVFDDGVVYHYPKPE